MIPEPAANHRIIVCPYSGKLSIQDLCREKKSELKLTSQEIAEKSGVPVSTVNNFFASASKAPGFYTAIAICAALGVSVDKHYGISDTPEQIITERLDHKDEVIAGLQHNNNNLRHIIFALLVILALAFVYGITLDILKPDMGLFRGGM